MRCVNVRKLVSFGLCIALVWILGFHQTPVFGGMLYWVAGTNAAVTNVEISTGSTGGGSASTVIAGPTGTYALDPSATGGLAVNAAGNGLYMTEGRFDMVYTVNTDGTNLTQLASPATGLPSGAFPYGIALDNNGHMYT